MGHQPFEGQRRWSSELGLGFPSLPGREQERGRAIGREEEEDEMGTPPQVLSSRGGGSRRWRSDSNVVPLAGRKKRKKRKANFQTTPWAFI